MKFGVFSVSMPECGIEESVRLLKELGYDGVEWRVAEMPEKEPENVPFALRYWACNKSTLELRSIEAEAAKAKALCDEAGLEIFGLTTYLATNELEPLTRVFHAARSIGCRQVRVGLVPYNPAKADAPYPVLFARLREDLKAIDALAAETGVKAGDPHGHPHLQPQRRLPCTGGLRPRPHRPDLRPRQYGERGL